MRSPRRRRIYVSYYRFFPPSQFSARLSLDTGYRGLIARLAFIIQSDLLLENKADTGIESWKFIRYLSPFRSAIKTWDSSIFEMYIKDVGTRFVYIALYLLAGYHHRCTGEAVSNERNCNRESIPRFPIPSYNWIKISRETVELLAGRGEIPG